MWLILAFLFSSALNLIGLEQRTRDSIEYWSGMSAIGLVLFLMIYAMLYKPVKILNLNEQSMEIKIKNDKYFNYFKALNIEHTIK